MFFEDFPLTGFSQLDYNVFQWDSTAGKLFSIDVGSIFFLGSFIESVDSASILGERVAVLFRQ